MSHPEDDHVSGAGPLFEVAPEQPKKARRRNHSAERILARLRRGPLTPLEAMREGLGMRLGARILELRERGHEIETKHVEVTNADGTVSRVARYVLVREAK